MSIATNMLNTFLKSFPNSHTPLSAEICIACYLAQTVSCSSWWAWSSEWDPDSPKRLRGGHVEKREYDFARRLRIRAAHGRKRPVGMLVRRAHAGDGRLEGHGLEIAAGLGVL